MDSTQHKKGGVSLDSLNMVRASDSPFEFEYITPDGRQTGIFLKILGGQSEVVTKAASKMINDRRRQLAAKELSKRAGSKQIDFDPIENDIEFGQRLAAVRLVGWSGITNEFTPENALLLCQTNKFIAAAIIEYSDDVANFMKL